MRIAFSKRAITVPRHLHYQTRERYWSPNMFTFHPIGMKSVSSSLASPIFKKREDTSLQKIYSTQGLGLVAPLKSIFLILSSTSAPSFSFCRVSVAKRTCNAISNGMLYVQCSAAINNPCLPWQGPKRVSAETEKHTRLLIYNFALGVSSASDSSYILSSSARNIFAVCGRLSLSLFIH